MMERSIDHILYQMQMAQRLTKHVICTTKQSGNCAVESPNLGIGQQ